MPIQMTREEYQTKYGEAPVTKSGTVKDATLTDLESQRAERGSSTFAFSPNDTGLQAGAKALGNVPSSAFNLGKNIFTAIANPIDTAKGVGNAITGGGRSLQRRIQNVAPAVFGESLGENEKADQVFGALKESMVDRYGSLENAQRTATEDPVGFGADVVALFSGASKIPALAPVVSRSANVVNNASKAFKAGVTTKFDDIALTQMTKALDLNPTDTRRIKLPNVYNDEPAKFMLEKGIKGSQESMVTQLDDLRIASKQSVDDGLANLTTPVTGQTIVPAQKTLQVLKETFEGTVGNEEFVSELSKLQQRNSYTLTELNEIKRLAQSQLDVYKSTGVLKDSAKAKGLNNVISELKTVIENEATKQGFPDVKAFNKDTQVAYEISQSLQKRLDVTGKANLPLRDAIIGAGGFATGSLPIAVGVIISRRVLESAGFRTHLANKLSSESPTKVTALQNAINNGNYNEVILYLAPIVNEFETSQQEAQ